MEPCPTRVVKTAEGWAEIARLTLGKVGALAALAVFAIDEFALNVVDESGEVVDESGDEGAEAAEAEVVEVGEGPSSNVTASGASIAVPDVEGKRRARNMSSSVCCFISIQYSVYGVRRDGM